MCTSIEKFVHEIKHLVQPDFNESFSVFNKRCYEAACSAESKTNKMNIETVELDYLGKASVELVEHFSRCCALVDVAFKKKIQGDYFSRRTKNIAKIVNLVLHEERARVKKSLEDEIKQHSSLDEVKKRLEYFDISKACDTKSEQIIGKLKLVAKAKTKTFLTKGGSIAIAVLTIIISVGKYFKVSPIT